MFSLKINQQPLIIVGGGLAGSLLAWSLIQKGIAVCIYADDKACASRVAAGLINPVTGQRFVLAEHIPEMLAFALPFYRNIEQQLQISCFHETPMKRIFSSEKELENCKKRLINTNYQHFLQKQVLPKELNAEFGGISQTQTAWLDTNVLLDALHAYFEQHNCINYATYSEDMSHHDVIYCQGYHSQANPLFSWLPMQASHGEIITCKTKFSLQNYIINKSKWLLPLSEHQCRIGATYDTSIHTPTLQASSKQQLLREANLFFSQTHTFEVVEHQAGIRPTTLDKQPFIGTHPQHKNLAIFNGFGSKGSLMIPWYANKFIHHRTPELSDIKRYQHLCA